MLNKFRVLSNELEEAQVRTQFLLNEVARINESRRYSQLKDAPLETKQIRDSYNYQWSYYNMGNGLPTDPEFMGSLQDIICHYTQLPKSWFEGKRVIDLGAGSGRFTYGMLSMGAEVTAIELSPGGCDQIRRLCQPFSERLTVTQADLLSDPLPQDFDLVFCYGVIHHTGNTYEAVRRACECAKTNGKLFFMVYGYPTTSEDFHELTFYEELRQELRNKPFRDKIAALKRRFPAPMVHGFFDAVSPSINELLRYEEMVDILKQFGVSDIARTHQSRNLHLVGTKSKTPPFIRS